MEEKNRKDNRILIVMAILSILFVFGSCLIVYLYWKGGDYEQRGTFGDMFGSVNAVFSGLAFAGIILAIFMQKKELESQREELRDTRSEFKINRLTNIIFKQIEYLNSQLDQIGFNWTPGVHQPVINIGLVEFVENLENFERKEIDIKKKMRVHDKTIMKAIGKVETAFRSFEKIAVQSQIEPQELKMLKDFMQSNVNPSFFSLVFLKIKSIEKPNSEFEDLKELEKAVFEIQINKLKYLLEYGN